MAYIYFEDELLKKAFKEQKKQDEDALRIGEYRESVRLAKEFCEEESKKDMDNAVAFERWVIVLNTIANCLDWLVGGCDFGAKVRFVGGDLQPRFIVDLNKYEVELGVVINPDKVQNEKDIKGRIARLAIMMETNHINKLLGVDYE